MLIAERLGLPPEEHSLVLSVCHVHERCHTLLVVGRLQTIKVAKLHDRTYALVVGDGFATLVLVGFAEHLRLYLHAEASAHSHVGAILQGHGAGCLMVGSVRDVGCHGYGREEVAGSPLHIYALQGVGIVACPELVEVWQCAPVDTSAAGSAILYGQFGIFGADALQHLLKAAVIFDEEVALVVGCEILRTVVRDVHVGVPLDVVNLRILGHHVVDDGEHEVLHLRIAEVEHHLCAAASALEVAVGSLYNPFGMLLEEFALGIGHLRLKPNTELYALLLGFGKQTLNAVRQLLLVYNPVAKRTVVDATLVLIAKPSVVHDEQFAAHRLDVSHHLRHFRLLDVEIYTLPRVK